MSTNWEHSSRPACPTRHRTADDSAQVGQALPEARMGERSCEPDGTPEAGASVARAAEGAGVGERQREGAVAQLLRVGAAWRMVMHARRCGAPPPGRKAMHARRPPQPCVCVAVALLSFYLLWKWKSTPVTLSLL